MPEFVRSVDGVRIAYEVHGAGQPALILVHGWCCHRKHWSAALPALVRKHRVVAIDLAGHGESGSDRSDWTMDAFARDVAAVVEKLALDDVVLVGHSMGADVVTRCARLLGGRERALIWIDQYGQLDRLMDEAAVDSRLATFRSGFEAATRAFVRPLFAVPIDPALVERAAREMSSVPETVALPCLTATWNHGREIPALLSELRIPVVAINASCEPGDAESLRRHGVELVTMRDVGHFPMLERPDEFAACLLRALEDLESTGTT